MGRPRKTANPHSLFSVGDTQADADAVMDGLEDLVEENRRAGKPGRKCRIDRLNLAVTIARAIPESPRQRGRVKGSTPIPRDCIGAAMDQGDAKDAKYDMQATRALSQALSMRGETITISNAVKIMQAARRFLREIDNQSQP
jgi:hypothetical protein